MLHHTRRQGRATHFSHAFFICIYLEATGCHISTSALYTKRGSQTWSLVASDQVGFVTSDLSHSFTAAWWRTTRNPVRRTASCQSVDTTRLAVRPPKRFISYTTRRGEVNAGLSPVDYLFHKWHEHKFISKHVILSISRFFTSCFFVLTLGHVSASFAKLLFHKVWAPLQLPLFKQDFQDYSSNIAETLYKARRVFFMSDATRCYKLPVKCKSSHLPPPTHQQTDVQLISKQRLLWKTPTPTVYC